MLRETILELQAEQGWTDATLLELVLQWVDTSEGGIDLEDWLIRLAEDENQAIKNYLQPKDNC